MKVFHTEDTHLRSGREPPDTKTAKVHLINSWQARAPLSLAQEVEWLRSPDAIEATVPFQ